MTLRHISLQFASIATAALAVTLAACNKDNSTSTAAQMASNPAAVCASQETIAALKDTILSNVSQPTDKIAKSYSDQINSGSTVSMAMPVLDNYDKQTKKVSCSGKITFNWPTAVVSRMKQISPGIDSSQDSSSITYSIQPQADGNGFVYSVDGPGSANIIGSAQAIITTLAQADQAAIDSAEAEKTAAAQAAAAAGDAAAEVVTGGATSSSPGQPAAAPATTTRYACSPAPDAAAGTSTASGVMSLTVDETRLCINNRTAYVRTSNGGLARVMLSDADRRVSVLSFSPDRGTFLRQDFNLSPAQYAGARQRGADLSAIACPATVEGTELNDVQARLLNVNHAISPILSGLVATRKLAWHCAPTNP